MAEPAESQLASSPGSSFQHKVEPFILLCLLAHVQVSLAIASDRPCIDSREGADTSLNDLQQQQMMQQV